MNGRHYRQKLASLARRVGWGRNPILRSSDRLEGIAVLAALVLAVAAVPLAMAVGTWSYHHNLAVSADQTAAVRPVTATLTRDAPVTFQGESLLEMPVQAQWTYPAGSRHTGVIKAAEGAQAGTMVPIWTTPTGVLTNAPLSPDQAWTRGGMTVVASMGGVLALLTAAVAFVHWRLNRKRYAAWDAEWQRIAPRWTQRTS
jgi:hypothetical protein